MYGEVDDEVGRRNWVETERVLDRMCPVVDGALSATVDLVAGDNPVSLPRGITNPRGRLTVFLSAAVDVYDVGLVSGRWVVNSSGAARARFLFF